MNNIILAIVIFLISLCFVSLLISMYIEFKKNAVVIKDSIANSTIILNYKFKRTKCTKAIRYKNFKISKVEGPLSLIFPYVIENLGFIKRNSHIKRHLDLIFKYGIYEIN